mmetsp:Transcript_71043/g.208219  ORF Transcript_71043/g.208219 Transcript_71043/m.208219 type:complete len:245 (-) Transcript_71043:663-1397(-)
MAPSAANSMTSCSFADSLAGGTGTGSSPSTSRLLDLGHEVPGAERHDAPALGVVLQAHLEERLVSREGVSLALGEQCSRSGWVACELRHREGGLPRPSRRTEDPAASHAAVAREVLHELSLHPHHVPSDHPIPEWPHEDAGEAGERPVRSVAVGLRGEDDRGAAQPLPRLGPQRGVLGHLQLEADVADVAAGEECLDLSGGGAMGDLREEDLCRKRLQLQGARAPRVDGRLVERYLQRPLRILP